MREQLEALHHRHLHTLIEDEVTAFAARLRDVHRRVGIAEQRFGARVPTRRVRHGESDARADEQLLAVDLERLVERPQHALGEFCRLAERLDIFDEQREFIAAEPRDGIRFAQACFDALGDLRQQLVAGRMPERVVDALEVIEVHKQHAEATARARPAQQRVLEAVGKPRAIGELGQRVVQRLVAQLFFERLALGDVADVQHEAADRGIIALVRPHELQVAPAAVRVADAALALHRLAALRHDVVQRGDEARLVVAVHAVDQLQADDRVWIEAEDSGDRRALVADGRVRLDHGDQVGAVLHERAEPLLALRSSSRDCCSSW